MRESLLPFVLRQVIARTTTAYHSGQHKQTTKAISSTITRDPVLCDTLCRPLKVQEQQKVHNLFLGLNTFPIF